MYLFEFDLNFNYKNLPFLNKQLGVDTWSSCANTYCWIVGGSISHWYFVLILSTFILASRLHFGSFPGVLLAS